MVDGLSNGKQDVAAARHALHEGKGAVAPFGRDLHGSASRRPRLLVSVRNTNEAIAALAGGADIIDVKEPRRGPLGMADANIVSDIVACAGDRAPVSAALGEVRDWMTPSGDAIPPPVVPHELAFVKLGLGGRAPAAQWIADWLAVRAAFEQAAGLALPWVAVAYADAQIADSPPVDDVIVAAARTGCRGVLIDTYDKSGGSVLELFSARNLNAFCGLAHSCGLFFAVAGRLRSADLRRRCLRNADVLGVRSAACADGDRLQPIAAAQVARLCRRLRANARRRARQ